MGFGGLTGGAVGSTNAMQHLNQFMLQNLQTLLAANPNFLTGGIPNKLLTQMWMEPNKMATSPYNVSVKEIHKLKTNKKLFFCHFVFQIQPEEEEHDDEEMGVAETYADYWPAKRKFHF